MQWCYWRAALSGALLLISSVVLADTSELTFKSLSPSMGSLFGSTVITIRGEGFTNGLSVKIGGEICAVLRVSEQEIKCETSPHGRGLTDIEITSASGTSTKITGVFTYTSEPLLHAVTPSYGTSEGGTILTLRGAGFQGGLAVKLGAEDCIPIYIAASLIQCKTQAHARTEAVLVSVINPDGQRGMLSNGYSFVAPPTIHRVVPTMGSTAGGTLIMLGGTNFDPEARVEVGGKPCRVTSASTTSISCNTPAHEEGATHVEIFNRDGQSSRVVEAYRYQSPPALFRIEKHEGYVAGGDVVNIYGRGFKPGVVVLIGGVVCIPVQLISSERIRCTTGRNTRGSKDIMMNNLDGGSAILPMAYTYLELADKPSCMTLVRYSNECGGVTPRYEIAAAFVGRNQRLMLRNGMKFLEVATFLPPDVAGTFLETKCSGLPRGVSNEPFPESKVVSGQRIQLMTDKSPGSRECPAYHTDYYSPIVIDLADRGIELTSPAQGVTFNLSADGAEQRITWIKNGSDVGILVLDKNKDGKIDHIDELFTNHSHGIDGRMTRNGFELLKRHDGNGDKFIDERDEVYPQLSLWFDRNGDGKSDDGELRSLKEAGVSRLDLAYKNFRERNDFFGNEKLSTSVVDMADGSLRRMVDLWLMPGPG